MDRIYGPGTGSQNTCPKCGYRYEPSVYFGCPKCWKKWLEETPKEEQDRLWKEYWDKY